MSVSLPSPEGAVVFSSDWHFLASLYPRPSHAKEMTFYSVDVVWKIWVCVCLLQSPFEDSTFCAHEWSKDEEWWPLLFSV